MRERIRELRERMLALATRMRELSDTAEAADRGLTSEEETERLRMVAEYDELEARLARAEEDLAREEELRSVPTLDGPPIPRGDDGDDDSPPDADARYAAAFERYVRYGLADLEREDRRMLLTGIAPLAPNVRSMLPAAAQRALSAVSGPGGGFTVPQGFLDRFTERRVAIGGMRAAGASVIQTDDGADLPWPTVDDSASEGEILGENQAVGSGDVAFGQRTLRAHMYTSKLILVPLQLLMDEQVDLEGRIAGWAARRIARIQNRHFTTGSGTGQPQGAITAGTVGKTGASGNVATFTWADLVDLEHAIDPGYREGARYMMSDQALRAIKVVLDGTGRPIWQPSTREGEPSQINGYGYVINYNMASPAANAKSLAFGNWEEAYGIRDVRGVTLIRLDERYMDNLQVGFFAFARSDGGVIDPYAYSVYQHPGS